MTNNDARPDYAVEVTDVSLRFGGLNALSGVSLAISPGETVGLVGTNGSGKTSLLNCISGIYHPQEGSIRIRGELTIGKAPHRVSALGVGRTLQSVETVKEMMVLNYVMLGRHQQQRGTVFRYAVGWAQMSGAEANERRLAMDCMESLGVEQAANLRMSEIPYGMAKMVDLARVLLGKPHIVLLDEPASGLSTDERVKISEVLRTIGDDPERAMIVVEHDLLLASRVCQNLLVLSAGAPIAFGPPREILNDQRVIDELLGGASLDMSSIAATTSDAGLQPTDSQFSPPSSTRVDES
jgi:branched-chain amino acid transport system ATP-binding protein